MYTLFEVNHIQFSYKLKFLVLILILFFTVSQPALSMAQDMSTKIEYKISEQLKDVIVGSGTWENFRSRIFSVIRHRNFEGGVLSQAGIEDIKQENLKKKGIIQSSEILKFDLNADLKVEKSEIVSYIIQNDQIYKSAYDQDGYLKSLTKNYMVLDSDKDNALSLAETRMLSEDFLRVETPEEKREQEDVLFLEYFLAKDPSRDGIITNDELGKISFDVFNIIDINKDRIISLEESTGYQNSLSTEPSEDEKEFGQGCKFTDIDFDDDLIVYAAGAYSGRPIEQQTVSGITATQFDVVVNETKAPIALILGTNENAIWNIKTTPKTNISAIVVGGYYQQFIAGVDKSVPILRGFFDPKSECNFFYINEGEFETITSVNKLSKYIFGKPITMVYLPDSQEKGKIIIGDKGYDSTTLITSKDNLPESYFLKTTRYSGEKGIKYGLEKGFLRKATKEEMDKWNRERVKIDLRRYEALPEETKRQMEDRLRYQYKEDPDDLSPPLALLSHAYIVLVNNYSIPAETGERFLVPEGIKISKGQIGSAAVYDINNMECYGCLRANYFLSHLKKDYGITITVAP
jgi:hypothetical protein